MIRKLALLALGCYIVGLYSCGRCPKVNFPYTDIVSIYANVESDSIANSDSLKFLITTDSINYVAKNNIGFQLIPSAYALSCEFDGYAGEKSPIVSLEIHSNADVDSLHPAGSSLNDLFMIRTMWAGIKTDSLLKDVDKTSIRSVFIPNNYPWTGTPYNFLFLPNPPTISSSHQFTILARKEDGSSISCTTATITW